MNTIDQATVIAEAQQFLRHSQTAYLATVAAEGQPTASYAPFIYQAPYIYIFISELSRHTQDLLATQKASVLFIEDEAQAHNPFARQRLSFQCTVQKIDREADLWSQCLAQFTEQFGDIVSVLKQLKDFHLFQLQLDQGQFVKGFGQAYPLDGSTLGDA